MRLIILILSLITTTALAQQQPPADARVCQAKAEICESALARTIGSVHDEEAQNAIKQIDLLKENADLKKQVADLKAKLDAAKPQAPAPPSK